MDKYIMDALNNTISSDIESKSTVYYNNEGIAIPRVTEIISRTIHSDSLLYWANSIGLKGQRYKAVLTNASNIGTEAHNAIERFLKDKIKSEDNIPLLGFLIWYNNIIQNMNIPIDIIYIEHQICCKWFGGTLDALMKINNRLYLVDFKTSNHITFTYFLQLAAYRFMLREVENINVDGVVILQLDKDNPGFNEYLLDFSILEHLNFMDYCENTFLSLVISFYNINRTENWFKNIFRGMI